MRQRHADQPDEESQADEDPPGNSASARRVPVGSRCCAHGVRPSSRSDVSLMPRSEAGHNTIRAGSLLRCRVRLARLRGRRCHRIHSLPPAPRLGVVPARFAAFPGFAAVPTVGSAKGAAGQCQRRALMRSWSEEPPAHKPTQCTRCRHTRRRFCAGPSWPAPRTARSWPRGGKHPGTGTDQRTGVIFDQQDGSAVGGWTAYGVIGAHSRAARHGAKERGVRSKSRCGVRSSPRTGRPGFRVR